MGGQGGKYNENLDFLFYFFSGWTSGIIFFSFSVSIDTGCSGYIKLVNFSWWGYSILI